GEIETAFPGVNARLAVVCGTLSAAFPMVASRERERNATVRNSRRRVRPSPSATSLPNPEPEKVDASSLESEMWGNLRVDPGGFIR
ncbi:MAG TPA: hypothetical protein VEL76_35845, partial [Gemmataceae bacterium]|nr:hypothetical protein [Gemmataceae bacterium]